MLRGCGLIGTTIQSHPNGLSPSTSAAQMAIDSEVVQLPIIK
jgi:hypothetical protein